MSNIGLNTGLKALLASQASLETIGHNVSNANTPGYSRQRLEVRGNLTDRAFVLFIDSHFEEFGGIAEALAGFVQGLDNLLKGGALAAQGLGALRVVPDVRVFQLAGDFFEPVALYSVVKDTP